MASDFDEKKCRHPINFTGLLPANPVLECGKASIRDKRRTGKNLVIPRIHTAYC